MIRNVLFTLFGLGLFVLGIVSGPKVTALFFPEPSAVVEVDQQKKNDSTSQPIASDTKNAPSQTQETADTQAKQGIAPTTDTAPKEEDKGLVDTSDSAYDATYDAESDPELIDGAFTETDPHLPSPEEGEDVPEVKEQIVEAKIEAGDSLLVLFQDYTDQKSAYALANVIDKEISVKKIRVGQPYLIEYDAEKDKIIRFEYEINSKEKLFVNSDGDAYKAKVEEIVYDKKLIFVEGTIKDSLFLTMSELNESPQLALQVANMFQWEINFIRDVQAGDSFSILVEKLYREGEFKGYGRTLGATFTNSGKKYESFLYYDANKKEMHYNAKGENLRKVLLQSPLSFTRVTSGYTHSRKHPVYGTYRPHLGVDYGAPMGTPIMAVGDGTITYFGWRGGYGKHISVRHASGLESMYSHMSRYGRGLKKGSKVRQGQVIGYVGSTGVSTGPHLDFRLKQNGKFINPTKAINPRAAAVSKVHKVGYEERKKIVREYMDGTRSLVSYEPASMNVPK